MGITRIRRAVCGLVATFTSCVAFAQAPVDNQRVTKTLNDRLQAALTGAKAPEQAMKDAQREAGRLLRAFPVRLS